MHIEKIISSLESCIEQSDLEEYLNKSFLEIQSLFYKLSYSELEKAKYEIEEICCTLVDRNLIGSSSDIGIVQAFMIFIAEELEKLMLTSAIVQISNHIPHSSVLYRLKADKLYLKVNDITVEYHENFFKIMNLLDQSNNIEEFPFKISHTAINYYLTALKSFVRIERVDLINSFKDLFLAEENLNKYSFLHYPLLKEIVRRINMDNLYNDIDSIKDAMRRLETEQTNILVDRYANIEKEQGEYAEQLMQLDYPTFDSLVHLSYTYIQRISDPQELHDRLEKGEIIIKDKELLYKYLASYGRMHKNKLFEAYDTFFNEINGKKINIIDWGCGQGMGSMLVFDYIQNKSLNIQVQNVTLIEPSILAIKRAMLHLDVLSLGLTPTIKTVQKDLDSIREKDILSKKKDNTITLHIFSNILDLETFDLNKSFLSKISETQQGTNYFICVSPNINAKRNNRLDLFFKYFKDNFNTELISSRNTKIGKYSRYEKIFKLVI